VALVAQISFQCRHRHAVDLVALGGGEISW
jgi:hypothetical protein